MIKREDYEKAQKRAAIMIERSSIKISDHEKSLIEVSDFGLNDLESEGLQNLTLFSTKRVSAKIIVLFAGQTIPEHWHPGFDNDPGKEETLRIVSGEIRLGLSGPDTIDSTVLPKGKEMFYTMRNELILGPCDQITLIPGTKHWFQALSNGAVIYSFSSCAIDALDRFTDKQIIRKTIIID